MVNAVLLWALSDHIPSILC